MILKLSAFHSSPGHGNIPDSEPYVVSFDAEAYFDIEEFYSNDLIKADNSNLIKIVLKLRERIFVDKNPLFSSDRMYIELQGFNSVRTVYQNYAVIERTQVCEDPGYPDRFTHYNYITGIVYDIVIHNPKPLPEISVYGHI